MEGEKLLKDITSRDPQCIWSSACAIIDSRDLPTLKFLAAHIEEINQKTKGIDLGGALHSNSNHLSSALDKLKSILTDDSCLCRFYLGNLFADPTREVEKGRVTNCVTTLAADNYVDHYTCECAVCGSKFHVTERQYHYTSYEWSRL